jgi:hypothetical protein
VAFELQSPAFCNSLNYPLYSITVALKSEVHSESMPRKKLGREIRPHRKERHEGQTSKYFANSVNYWSRNKQYVERHAVNTADNFS